MMVIGDGRTSISCLRIMKLLKDRGETYGLGILQELGMGPGSVYPILRELNRKGWVESRRDKVAIRRIYHKLTPYGIFKINSFIQLLTEETPNKFDYPELIEDGTVVGPVTPEMRDRCKEKVRRANRLGGCPENQNMDCWPDFISAVREEMAAAESEEIDWG